MPCYSPRSAYRGEINTQTGKREIIFNEKLAQTSDVLELPCRNCIGCRLDKAADWATRLEHEAKYHDAMAFVTLTYNPENVPKGETLIPDHVSEWLKALRQKLKRHHGDPKIRFYACGEYGEKLQRPHYHVIIFGWNFPDKVPHYKRPNGQTLYTSALLAETWPYGYSSVGTVTPGSIAYVAKYSLKKVNGERSAEHYEYIDPITGVIYDREPEFARMSRMPGIGLKWFEEFKGDIAPSDFIIRYSKKGNPYKTKLPDYYVRKLEEQNPDLHEEIVENRKINPKKKDSLERLETRAKVAELSRKNLKRDLT